MLATCVACTAFAGSETQPSLVVPKRSVLAPSASTSFPLLKTTFSGQVWVSGLFLAQWPGDIKKPDSRAKIEVSIKLDKKERDDLPYYDWPEWKKSYIPDSVGIFNGEEAVKLVFPKQLSTKLLSRQIQLAKVHGRFLLTDYQIRIECDWPWANAKLLSAEVTENAKTNTKLDLDDC